MLAPVLLLLLSSASAGAQQPKADVASIRAWFQKRNPSLTTFQVAGRHRIDDQYSIAVATAYGDARTAPAQLWFGVFVVAGGTNRVGMVLDMGPAPRCCGPKLRAATGERALVDWFSDYGFYGGTYKYAYDLPARKLTQRWSYRRFAVQSARHERGFISFTGVYEAPLELNTERPPARVSLVYRTTDQRWTVGGGHEGSSPVPAHVVQLPGGRWLDVKQESPGQAVQNSGVQVGGPNRLPKFYPVPLPTLDRYQRLRANRGNVAFTPGPPNELQNSIGPFAFDGEKLWFANRFYDGEGVSGVGAIGTFDPATRRYQMRYLPEIAPWSGSGLAVDDHYVWVGLMRQLEGSAYGGGLLRISKTTGEVRKYPVPGYISTISQVGAVVYLGTEDGVYTPETGTDELTHITVEPGPEGPRTLVIGRAGR